MMMMMMQRVESDDAESGSGNAEGGSGDAE